MKINIIKSFANYLVQVCSTTFNGHFFRGVPDVSAHNLVPSIGHIAKFANATQAHITPATVFPDLDGLAKSIRYERA